MRESLKFSREVPVDVECDVCVVGGGPAGIAAAVAARLGGATVFLAEGHSCLGGMSTAGLVPGFSGFGDGVNPVAAGIGRRLLNRLRDLVPGNPEGGSIEAETFKRICDEFLLENNVRFRLMTPLVGVECRDGRITAAVFTGKGGLFAIRSSVFIDCTGDGDLAVMAGAPWETGGSDNMPGSLCSRWGNVDFGRYRACGHHAGHYLPQAFQDGVFRVPDPHHPGMWELPERRSGGNLGHLFGLDATDSDSLTAGLVEGRRQMPEFAEFYRKYVPGFEQAILLETASLPGVRESRRITGEYVLNIEDYLRRAEFPDEIGRYCYPIDMHMNTPDPEAYARFIKQYRNLAYRPGDSYGIPYRILLPLRTVNLLCAGRCVSTDRQVHSSLRVIPGCFITGQAAGAAAALALDCDGAPRKISLLALRESIRKLGGYLPRFPNEAVPEKVV